MMNMAVIEEPLICHTICSYLKPWDLDRIRLTSSHFLEATSGPLKKVNVIATCGLYIGVLSDGIRNAYFMPCSDEQVRVNTYSERGTHYTATVVESCCKIVKPNVDHVLFGNFFGFIYNDHIDLVFANFSDDTLLNVPRKDHSPAVILDNRTKKYADSQNISLRQCLFEEAIIVTTKPTYQFLTKNNQNYYTFTGDGTNVLMKPKSGYATIAEFIKAVSSHLDVKKITFDGRLLIHD